jgi:tetratricopeptide (TPR) repeat protein
MNWKRILRDGSILVLLGAIFYFSASAIERFSFGNEGAFSKDRQLADEYFAEHKWEQANAYYQKLATQDPYNGYAWYYQAVCQYWMRAEIEAEIEEKKQAGSSDDEFTELKRKLNEVEGRVIELFNHSSQFFRHRRRSLVNLAIIHTSRKEWEKALEILEVYVSEENLLNRSLEFMSGLGVGGRDKMDQDPELDPNAKLHCFPRFWDLVDEENSMRSDFPVPSNFPRRDN